MKTKRQSQQGMALLLALFFSATAVILLGGLTMRLLHQRNLVNRYVAYNTCFFGLEAAYQQSKLGIENGQNGWVGLGGWTPDSPGALPDFDDPGVTPISVSGMPGVEFIAHVQHWGNDGIDNTGDGAVDGSNEAFTYTSRAFARYAGVSRDIEVVLKGFDVNVWRNAIFAGNGQAGGVINGNVSVHGSVHILGNNIPSGGTSISAIDLSGTSLIHNNYVGIPAGLAARIPPLPTTVFNGEQVQTLDANLRVKRGLVGMSGNSEIGSPDVAGNTVKETMDGTYVTDGWTGNSVTSDGYRGIPTRVSSDNGWSELYDLGDRVAFPVLSDDWRAPVTGNRVWNDSTGDWYSHEDYFTQVLLANPAVPNDGIYNGNIDIFTRGSHFYWNATTGQMLSGSLPATAPGANDDFILFNQTNKTLQINGQIVINGNLTIRGQGNDMTVNYSGRGALLVNGDVRLDTNLLSCNNLNPSNTANSFPVNNIIGIMARNNMIVGSAAQISLMGAFYAQGSITSAKQTNVIGTFVSNYFNMGTNVPSIFQVPALADNLPLGMIGNFPILAISAVSWREPNVVL